MYDKGRMRIANYHSRYVLIRFTYPASRSVGLKVPGVSRLQKHRTYICREVDDDIHRHLKTL